MMKNIFFFMLEAPFVLKGARALILRQILATENPLEMMKSAFYFILKALFVFKIFNFLSCLLGHVEKRLG